MDFYLGNKLSDFFEKKGYKYRFFLDEEYTSAWGIKGHPHLKGHPYLNYVSLVLRTITGVMKAGCAEEFENSYDIELVNKLTKLLYESGDKDLERVAWNTFVPCMDDKRFILHEEMQKAYEAYPKLEDHAYPYPSRYGHNNTKEFETENFIVRPFDFLDKKFKDIELHKKSGEFNVVGEFIYPDDNYVARFSVFLKQNLDKPIGFLELSSSVKFLAEENTAVLSYAIRKDLAKTEYLKEAVNGLIKVIKNKEIIYCVEEKQYAFEEIKPEIQRLCVLFDEENNQTLEPLEFDGIFNIAYNGVEPSLGSSHRHHCSVWFKDLYQIKKYKNGRSKETTKTKFYH